MHNSGVATGAQIQRASIPVPAEIGRIGKPDRLDPLSRAARPGRDAAAAAQHVAHITRQPGGDGWPAPPRRDLGTGADLRHGAPSSAYLAQHIAQEVDPDAPGADTYRAGLHAYVLRRDSTLEILSGAPRLDVFV